MRQLGFRLFTENHTTTHFAFFVFVKVKVRQLEVTKLLEAGKYKAR